MTVHDIEVNALETEILNHLDAIGEAGVITGQKGRGKQRGVHGDHQTSRTVPEIFFAKAWERIGSI